MTPALLLCTLISVTDGDTIRAACPDTVRIRIANIDAPERDKCPRPAARAAGALLALAQGPLTVQPLYTDHYGRIVATVASRDGDLAEALLSLRVVKPWPHDMRGRPLAKRPRGC